MYQMSELDKTAEEQTWQKLYEEAQGLIERIYSRKLHAKEMEKLEGL